MFLKIVGAIYLYFVSNPIQTFPSFCHLVSITEMDPSMFTGRIFTFTTVDKSFSSSIHQKLKFRNGFTILLKDKHKYLYFSFYLLFLYLRNMFLILLDDIIHHHV